MNYFQKFLSLFCVFALVAICSAGNPYAFNVFTGELITIEPEISEESEETETASTEAPTIEPVDLSNAVLTISYETTNSEGEVETESIYEGSFKENFVYVPTNNNSRSPDFSEPTDLKISLKISEDSDPMTIDTVIDQGSDFHFAYVDHPGPRDEFLLMGSSSQVMNPEKKFTVTGHLGFLDSDSLHTTSAFVWATFINADGDRQSKQWGPVLVKDGSFTIEGDVDRPTNATLYVRNQASFVNATASLILQPKGHLVVAKLGNQTQEISAVSGTGYHAQMIESWQQSSEYVALVEAWTSEQERARNAPAETADETEAEGATDSDEDVADNEEDTETDSEDTSETEASVELVDAVEPAEGCEDAVAQEEEESEPEAQTTAYEYPKWYTLRMEASAFRTEKLQDIAKNSESPNAQLLAMQMGVFSPYDDAEEALAIWRSLAEKFGEDFVATYISPELERIELVNTRTLNNEALIPGQKVPAFTLASLDGDDVTIYDLMGEKDMVLIDFWASWCGPCIATFPDLKKLHAAYTDENFEIVGVSVDSNLEDWSGGVEDHQLPWVQLGELKDADDGSPVSTSYGVNFIPTTFLVDSQGCIYRKNIHPTELKTFLVDRYGLDESLVEPEEEPEDTPEVSS